MLTVAIILIGCVYLRGWLSIRKTRAQQFTPLRLSCFLLGLDGSVDGGRISAGRLRRRFAQRTHGAASASHVYCSAFAAARLAGCSAAARTAGMDTQAGVRSASASRRAAPPRALDNFAACSMAGDEPDLSRLACARGLRFCAHTRTLARFRARLFSRQLARILVVRHSALADTPMAHPEAMEQLGIGFVSSFGRPREHRSLRLPRVLRLAGLSLLPHAAQSLSRLTAIRSGSGSGHHVGGWFVRFPGPSDVDYFYAFASAFHAHGVSSGGRFDGVLTFLSLH